MEKFYLADEKHRSVKGEIVDLKGLLYFKQDRSGYEGKATKDHLKEYPRAFEEFRKLNPDYVLPDYLRELVIGHPESFKQEAKPQVAAVVEEVAPVQPD